MHSPAALSATPAQRRHTTIVRSTDVQGPLPEQKKLEQAGIKRNQRYTRALVANTPWYVNASSVLQHWRDGLFLRMQKEYAALEKQEYSGPHGEQKPIVR